MNYLFKDFLKDKDIYTENIEFWKNQFNNTLANIEFEKYFNTTFANGEDFLDGNPIFNFRLKNSNRAVFIVQEEPESEDVYIKSWIDQFEADNETIIKLVIILELSEKSQYLALDLVKKWIAEQKNQEELENYIESLQSLPVGPGKNSYNDMFCTKRSLRVRCDRSTQTSLSLKNQKSTLRLNELLDA